MGLPVSAAFHSPFVSDAAEGFREKMDSIQIHQGTVPVYSNVTAAPYPEVEIEARHLLGEHLVSPVRFMEQIENMYSDGVRTFVEVGPKKALTGLVQAILKGRTFHAFSMDESSGKRHGLYDLAQVVCRLAAAGYPVDLYPWNRIISELEPP